MGYIHEEHLRNMRPSAKFIAPLSILWQHVLTITILHTLYMLPISLPLHYKKSILVVSRCF